MYLVNQHQSKKQRRTKYQRAKKAGINSPCARMMRDWHLKKFERRLIELFDFERRFREISK